MKAVRSLMLMALLGATLLSGCRSSQAPDGLVKVKLLK